MLMSSHPSRLCVRSTNRRIWRRECGVPDGTDFHSLRRTFLTLMEHKGTDYIAVARFVGHQIRSMMHAVYSAGASREALLRLADATRYGLRWSALWRAWRVLECDRQCRCATMLVSISGVS